MQPRTEAQRAVEALRFAVFNVDREAAMLQRSLSMWSVHVRSNPGPPDPTCPYLSPRIEALEAVFAVLRDASAIMREYARLVEAEDALRPDADKTQELKNTE